MDNVVTGTNCDDKASEYYSLAQSYRQEAGTSRTQDNAHAAQTTNILGLTWNSTNDMLSLFLETKYQKIRGYHKLY